MKRNLKTKLLSVLLAVAMVITSITVWPVKEEVKAASDYVELTFSDFGLANNIYTGPSWSTNSTITTLDGVAITGEMLFLSTGAHAGFRLDPLKDDWGNFQVYRAGDNGELLVVTHHTAGSGSTTLYVSQSDLGVTDWSTDRVKVRLCFDKASDTSLTMTVTMSFGDKSKTQSGTLNDVADMVTSEDGYRIGAAGSVVEPGIGLYSVEREYKEWTFSDFGMADGTYKNTDGGTKYASSDINSLDGLALTGDVVFSSEGEHKGFRLRPVDGGDDWATFQIYRVGTLLVVACPGSTYPYTDTSSNDNASYISADDLQVDDLSTATVRMRLCFDKRSDSTILVKTTMSVGEVSVTRIGMMSSAANLVGTTSGYQIGPGGSVGDAGISFYSVKPEPRTLTFSDLGIEDGNYAGTYVHGALPSDVASWDNVTVVGNITMPTSDSGAYIGWAGTESVVSGLKYFANTSEEVWFWNDLTGNNHVGIPTGKTDDAGNVLGAVTGESMKISLTFQYVGNDVNIIYIINDIWTLNWTFNDTVEALGRKVVVSGNVTVASYVSEPAEQEPITLTFSDLGIADGNYAGSYAHGELPDNVSSWDNVTVIGNITMPSNDSGAYIGWAGTTDIASGLKYFANTSTETWYWNDLTGKNHVSVSTGHTDEAGNVLGTITGESMKISVTFEIEGNDVNMIYVINDTWTLKWTFTETAEAMGRRLVVSGNVTVESIIKYTELTFCDLGIGDGNYNNTSATGQLPSDVESWDKVAITGIIQLPKNNDGPYFAFGGTESIPKGISLWGANGNQIWFWNNLVDSTHQGFTEGQEDADGDILGTVQGTPFKIRLEFLEDGTDLNVKLTINDTWDKSWTYTDMIDTIGRLVQVSGDVTVTSVVEYTELTLNDLGFADGNYSGKTATGQLPTGVDSWDKVAISGYLTFYGEGDGNAFRIGGVAAGESVAMFYSGGQFWLWDNLTSNHQGIDASAGTTGTPLKVRMEFLELGSDLRMTLYINDVQAKVVTYTNMPSVIGNTLGLTGNITVGIPEEPLAVSFNSFGMEANKILGMTTTSTMVPENATTLDSMLFSGYVTLYENSSYGGQGKVSFGVNESGTGVDMWLDGSNLWFWDSTGGFEASGVGYSGISFAAADCGISEGSFVGQEVKVEVAFTYTDEGVELYVSINGYEQTKLIPGLQNYIGTGIKVTAGNSAVAYRSSLGEQYSVDNRLNEAGYKRVTVADFTGLEYKSYNRTTATGTYTAENMDGTYLDMDVNFTDIMFVAGDGGQANILYGADDDGWEGIWIRSNAAENHFVICGISIPYTSLGMASMEETFNVKIALKTTTVDGVNCYLASVWVNDIQICAEKQVVDGNIGNKLLVWSADTVDGTANTSTITFEPTQYTEVTRKAVSYSLRGYDHKTAQNYLVTGEATVTKNGEAYAVTDNQISEPGDYTIVTEVASTAHRYTQVVSLYILGDVDLNGTAGESTDLAALKKMIQTVPYKVSTAAEYAADIDNDGTVDSKDVELLESVVGDADALTTVLKQYHVPALAYDYLGGDDVMPISGYFGPYTDSSRSYVTDDVYQKIKDSGINLINHSVNDAGYDLAYVREALELAEKYNIGWFVSDYKVNPKVNVLNNNAVDATAEMLTTTQLAARLGFYSYYDSFLGNHIKDEPSYNGGDQNQDYNMMDYYTDASAQLNGFANTLGLINLPAEDARTINNYNSWITSWRTQDNYDEYWTQYVTDSKPKVYSADDYQFFGTAGTDDAESYFRTLGKIREQSLANNTPFWYYVQVGGDFDHDNASTDSSKIATEAETYWCLNTALAFGAKGIEWFPTIQPPYFDGISDPSTESSADRNGLILSDGTTSTYYEWVKTANAQIAAVDDVLMKATNKAIVATGTYAVREIEEEGCTTVASSYGKLTGVTASNTTQGAVVGCFDYRDTQAFYVMNYSVDGEQTITLTFDNNYDVRIVQDAVNTCGRTMTNKTITLTIGAGRGALVVLESTEDQCCYYLETTDENGEKIFKCQHGSVSTNAGAGELYGDINISDDVNAKDLVRMKKVEAKLEKLRFLGIADLNGDGVINKDDVSLLQKHLVGWVPKE